jgi:hypothetical protein
MQTRSMTRKVIYSISNVNSKNMVQNEIFTNTLSTGKLVTITVTTIFRWGCFEIELTNKEKEEISLLDEVELNNYDSELIEMDDGCSIDLFITNEDEMTEDEIKEISETTEDLNDSILEENGWYFSDTQYIMGAPIELDKI